MLGEKIKPAVFAIVFFKRWEATFRKAFTEDVSNVESVNCVVKYDSVMCLG